MTDRSRAVLVTGASRGIGAAVARAFAAAGDCVAVHYGANADKAREVAASLPGVGHVVVGADLGDADAVRRMVDEAATALGGLDVLVNNAGVFERHPITETTYDDWQRAWQRTQAGPQVSEETARAASSLTQRSRPRSRVVTHRSGDSTPAQV